MSYVITGTTIIMTRGDTVKANISILNADGTVYTPVETDRIVFTVKENYKDEEPKLTIEIPYDTMQLVINSSDTKSFKQPFSYVYDIQLTQADGTVSTFITKAKLKITEEVG